MRWAYDWLPTRYAIMTLIVAVELPSAERVRAFRMTDHRVLVASVERIAARFRGVDLACIAFERKARPGEGTDVLNVTQASLRLADTIIDPGTYAEQVNAQRAPPELHEPRPKRINKTVNDVLAWWSARYLSRQMAVNDLDAVHGFREGATPLLIELKRSGVPGWKPYLDDVPNFVLLRSLADLAGCLPVIVRYADRIPCKADLFTFPDVSWTRIAGQQVRIDGTDPHNTAARILAAARTVTAEGSIAGGKSYDRIAERAS